MGLPMKLMATEIEQQPDQAFEFPEANGEQDESKNTDKVAKGGFGVHGKGVANQRYTMRPMRIVCF